MKFNQSLEVSREESFDIGIPDVSIISVSSEIRIRESVDGKCHVRILAGSKKAAELIHAVEIVASEGKLNVHVNKKNQTYFVFGNGGLHHITVELMLPKLCKVKIKAVSADIEINQILSSLEIVSVSGDVTIDQNPETTCIVKTVSGNIESHTFSACDYTLKSVSGDIKVYVAPDLNVDVDGNSISGDLSSEISLDSAEDSPIDKSKVVKIISTTISGDFNLVRN